jgi:hypothetical protein
MDWSTHQGEYCFDNCEYSDTTFAFRMGSGLGLGW